MVLGTAYNIDTPVKYKASKHQIECNGPLMHSTIFKTSLISEHSRFYAPLSKKATPRFVALFPLFFSKHCFVYALFSLDQLWPIDASDASEFPDFFRCQRNAFGIVQRCRRCVHFPGLSHRNLWCDH